MVERSYIRMVRDGGEVKLHGGRSYIRWYEMVERSYIRMVRDGGEKLHKDGTRWWRLHKVERSLHKDGTRWWREVT